MSCKLTIIKKNGQLGGVCPMDTKELIIGRHKPALRLPFSCRRLSRSVCLSRGRDPDSCDIQIRLPEVSKRQAKIEKDDQDKVAASQPAAPLALPSCSPAC